jgi:uncharacterized protein YjeT (DUF2065 family)
MSDNSKPLALEDEVPFTYPQGFEQMAASLDFLPDDGSREQMLMALASGMLIM